MRRPLLFIAVLAVVPLGFVIYLFSARPDPGYGDTYAPMDLSDLTSTRVTPEAADVADVPRKFRGMQDKLVMLEGEIFLPTDGPLQPNEFLLIDRQANPQRTVSGPWQFVLVRMPVDKKVQPLPGPIRVYGSFRISPLRKPMGAVWCIYQLDGYWTQVL